MPLCKLFKDSEWEMQEMYHLAAAQDKTACMCAKLLQSCLTLCYPLDCSLPGGSVHKFSDKNTGVGYTLFQGIF